MPKYRKKPVVIEAVHFSGSSTSIHAIKRWVDGNEYVQPVVETMDIGSLAIETLEGTMTASPGDWIIKGVHGEFYPCKPDIFAATYELVEDR